MIARNDPRPVYRLCIEELHGSARNATKPQHLMRPRIISKRTCWQNFRRTQRHVPRFGSQCAHAVTRGECSHESPLASYCTLAARRIDGTGTRSYIK